MTTRKGRPRSFDRATALSRATELFWRHGYEGTSIADLTGAMGISPPSLYAAFGDKRTLFTEVVDAYTRTHGAFLWESLEEDDVRAAFAGILRTAAETYTAPGHPTGCLVITAATNCSPHSCEVEQDLRERRVATVNAFQARLSRAEARGQLPAGTEPRALAVYFGSVIEGMSQQARDGATREELEQVADLAMAVWPQAPPAPDGA